MKKLLALILALVMALAMTACGGNGGDTENTGDDEKAPAIKVGLLLEGSLGDESINDQAYEGLLKVAEDFGVETKYVAVSYTHLRAHET